MGSHSSNRSKFTTFFGYSILASSSTVNSGLYRNNNGSYPYDYGSAMSITGASDNLAGYYYFFTIGPFHQLVVIVI